MCQKISEYWSADPTNPITKADAKNLVTRTLYGGGLRNWLDILRGVNHMEEEHADWADYSTETKDLKNDNGVSAPPEYLAMKQECELITKIVRENNPALAAQLTVRARPGAAPQSESEKAAARESLNRKVLSYFFQTVENFITYTTLEYLIEVGQIRPAAGGREFVWGYDGITWRPPGGPDGVDWPVLLTGIRQRVLHKCGTAFNRVRFINKPFEEGIPLLADDQNPLWLHEQHIARCQEAGGVAPRKKTKQEEIATNRTYGEFKAWFEKTVFKDERRCQYGICQYDERGYLTGVQWASETLFRQKYRQYCCLQQNAKGEWGTQPVINKWLEDPDLRMYEYSDMFAPPSAPPSRSVFNTWVFSPFHDRPLPPGVEEDEEDLRARDMFLDLLRIVSGGVCGPEYNFLRWFIADMIQKPGRKPGVIPISHGSEGCGKTIAADLVATLVGMCRTLSCQLKNLTGDFNSLLDGKVFVILDELSKGNSAQKAAVFKGLVTSKKIVINGKNMPEFEVESVHRFWGTTNDLEVVESDRRPVYMTASLELKRGTPEARAKLEYLHNLRDDPSPRNMKKLECIYRYFQQLDMIQEFGSDFPEPPVTALSADMRQARSKWSGFAEYLVRIHAPVLTVDLSGAELFEFYRTYLAEKGIAEENVAPANVVRSFCLGVSWTKGQEPTISEPFHRPGSTVQYRRYNFVKMQEELAFI